MTLHKADSLTTGYGCTLGSAGWFYGIQPYLHEKVNSRSHTIRGVAVVKVALTHSCTTMHAHIHTHTVQVFYLQ